MFCEKSANKKALKIPQLLHQLKLEQNKFQGKTQNRHEAKQQEYYDERANHVVAKTRDVGRDGAERKLDDVNQQPQ